MTHQLDERDGYDFLLHIPIHQTVHRCLHNGHNKWYICVILLLVHRMSCQLLGLLDPDIDMLTTHITALKRLNIEVQRMVDNARAFGFVDAP